MPQDGIVVHPVFDATRAITIAAPPDQIFPWLVQMGFDRAGFYGYDLIENVGSHSGIRSANAVLPALQNPHPGDALPISVAATLAYGPIQRNHYVIWQSRDVPSDGVFIWELVPIDPTHTRLISRIRWNYVKTPQGFALGLFTEFADHVAVRRILEGVRDRAEGRPAQSLAAQTFEITTWLIAASSFLISIFFIAYWREGIWAWLLALGAGLLLEYTLYGGQALSIRETVAWLYFVGISALVIRTFKAMLSHEGQRRNREMR